MNEIEILNFMKVISLEAGNILLNGFRSKEIMISYKSRTNLVTNIDKESENFLYNRIREKYPDHTIIAEEGSEQRTENDYIWYVDPLDATNNYAHGIPYFSVSIGVFSRAAKRVVAGVVFDPFHQELFSACRGNGAFLNDEQIHTSGTTDLGISLLATGFPYNKADMNRNNHREFIAFLPRAQGIRRIGSASLDLSYVACGRIDGYWEPMLYAWDMAAGSLIVEEAGGTVTKYNGDPFDPEYPEILATNGTIHAQMIDILSTIA